MRDKYVPLYLFGVLLMVVGLLIFGINLVFGFTIATVGLITVVVSALFKVRNDNKEVKPYFEWLHGKFPGCSKNRLNTAAFHCRNKLGKWTGPESAEELLAVHTETVKTRLWKILDGDYVSPYDHQ